MEENPVDSTAKGIFPMVINRVWTEYFCTCVLIFYGYFVSTHTFIRYTDFLLKKNRLIMKYHIIILIKLKNFKDFNV
jgi:hypothetical protein